jgi:hypothetical protein
MKILVACDRPRIPDDTPARGLRAQSRLDAAIDGIIEEAR